MPVGHPVHLSEEKLERPHAPHELAPSVCGLQPIHVLASGHGGKRDEACLYPPSRSDGPSRIRRCPRRGKCKGSTPALLGYDQLSHCAAAAVDRSSSPRATVGNAITFAASLSPVKMRRTSSSSA